MTKLLDYWHKPEKSSSDPCYLMRPDKRAQTVLKALIERHIAEGQPVGSQALAKISGLEVSSATIRNILADLEQMGFVASPHTSAGRIPTPRGYRFFVDQLLSIQHFDESTIQSRLPSGAVQLPKQKILADAATLLSQLSAFAGVIVTPRHESVFQQIEFMPLSEKKILLIIVSPSGDVQNRFLVTDTDYTPAQLKKAAQHINAHYAGLQLNEVKLRLHEELRQLRDDMTRLMQIAIETSSHALEEHGDEVVISGERNLLGMPNGALNLTSLRQVFDLFEQKSSLMQLLDSSSKATGIQIYIGGESSLIPLEDMSMVTASYAAGGKVIGTLGVIGPTRMAYDRIIPIVDITARLLSNVLSEN